MTISEFQKKLTEKGWALLPLRLMIGFGFAAHGYAKLSRGPDNFARILSAIGVPHPHIMAWLTSVLEFVGGISLMAGAFVVPFSIPLAVVMLTAMFSVHFQYGFSSIRLKAVTAAGAEFGPIGYEMNLLYVAGLLTLAIGGSGKPSIDQFLKMRSSAQIAGNPQSSGATEDNTERGADPTEVEERRPDIS
jgi:putative oxidoreductase